MNKLILLSLSLILSTSITSATPIIFNETGQDILNNCSYGDDFKCFQFVEIFIEYNPSWGELVATKNILDNGSWGISHSLAWKKKNSTSVYVHDPSTNKSTILSFNYNGKPTFIGGADYFKKYNYFNFEPPNTRLEQTFNHIDNRIECINHEFNIEEIYKPNPKLNETGEQAIEGMIYEHHSVCWQFTKTFLNYNPTWASLSLGSGENFFNPHSVAYLRRDNNSTYVHDAWGGDTFIAEFDKNGSVKFWTHLEGGVKVFETRNKMFLTQYDHFHFSPVGHMSRRVFAQDNRMTLINQMVFINGEI